MAKVDSLYLHRLARERGTGSREQFAAEMATLFTEHFPAMTPRECTLAFEILERTIHDVEMELRKTVSAQLAAHPDVPHTLAKMLANDDIEVAFPVLSLSPVLLDNDLVEIVRARSFEYQLAIAQRPHVGASVADALVERGETPVIVELLLNPNAELSSATFEYLVDESRRVTALREPLVRRRDLPTPLALRMVTWVSVALRQYLLDNHDLDDETVNAALETAVSSVTAATTETDSESVTTTLVETLDRKGTDLADMLVKALREGEIALFISLFDKRTHLGYSRIMRLLQDRDGHGLAVACKAAGLGKAAFVEIFACCRRARALEATDLVRDVQQALNFYDRVDAGSARDVVQDWWSGTGYREALREVRFA